MENKIIKSGIRNTIYILIAQGTTFILGISKNLILPIMLGVTNFGYWQVYILYFSYVGLFSLGYSEGVYLRYGKYNYKELPKEKFRTSIKQFIFIQIIITLLVSFVIIFEPDKNKQFAMLLAAINIPISGITNIFLLVLQVTNQMKKYSFFIIFDKIVMLFIILIILFFKINKFTFIVVADTLSKFLVLILLVYACKELLFGKGVDNRTGIKETMKNIKVGLILMLANYAGILVLGFGRFIIERFESIEVYGTYAFAVSTISLVLVFISAVSLVIYPTLSRLDKSSYANYFIELNKILNVIVYILLLSYFPLSIFISIFLKNYTIVFQYLPVVFAIIYYQSKILIQINPYYNLLREEKALLKANATGLIIAISIISTAYFLSHSVLLVVIGTFISLGLRIYLSEMFLKKKLLIKSYNNIFSEIVIILIFIFCAYQKNMIIGFIIFATIAIVYTIMNIKSIKKISQYIFKK